MASNRKLNGVTITHLQNAFQANLSNLEQGKPYLLQELVGEELWTSMPTGTRKQLGHEFKALVKGGLAGIEWGGRRSDNCQVYHLK